MNTVFEDNGREECIIFLFEKQATDDINDFNIQSNLS